MFKVNTTQKLFKIIPTLAQALEILNKILEQINIMINSQQNIYSDH